MKAEAYLIQDPRLQPRFYRTSWGVVTTLFWAAYLYLWMPVLTLVVWFLGLRTAIVEVYLHEQRIDEFLVIALPLVAVAAAMVLIGWAEMNRLRFTGRERRLRVPDVSIDEVAPLLGASLAIAESLGRAKIAVVQMDADANPLAVMHLGPELCDRTLAPSLRPAPAAALVAAD